MEWTLATTTSRVASSSSSWSRRPVLQDVDLYASQYAKRCQFLVEPRDHLQLAPEALRGQTTRHRETRTVVGESEVVVAKGNGRLRHLGYRTAAVGPVRVSMAVTPQGSAERERFWAEGFRLDLFQLGQIARDAARDNFSDHASRRIADAWDVLQSPEDASCCTRSWPAAVDGGGGLPESAHLVGLGAVALEQIGNPAGVLRQVPPA